VRGEEEGWGNYEVGAIEQQKSTHAGCSVM